MDVPRVAAGIGAVFAEHWAAPLPPLALYMEHGRYVTGPCGYLVAQCHAVKTFDDNVYECPALLKPTPGVFLSPTSSRLLLLPLLLLLLLPRLLLLLLHFVLSRACFLILSSSSSSHPPLLLIISSPWHVTLLLPYHPRYQP